MAYIDHHQILLLTLITESQNTQLAAVSTPDSLSTVHAVSTGIISTIGSAITTEEERETIGEQYYFV